MKSEMKWTATSSIHTTFSAHKKNLFNIEEMQSHLLLIFFFFFCVNDLIWSWYYWFALQTLEWFGPRGNKKKVGMPDDSIPFVILFFNHRGISPPSPLALLDEPWLRPSVLFWLLWGSIYSFCQQRTADNICMSAARRKWVPVVGLMAVRDWFQLSKSTKQSRAWKDCFFL